MCNVQAFEQLAIRISKHLGVFLTHVLHLRADRWVRPASRRRDKSENMTQIRRRDPVVGDTCPDNSNKPHLISMIFYMTSKFKALFNLVILLRFPGVRTSRMPKERGTMLAVDG